MDGTRTEQASGRVWTTGADTRKLRAYPVGPDDSIVLNLLFQKGYWPFHPGGNLEFTYIRIFTTISGG